VPAIDAITPHIEAILSAIDVDAVRKAHMTIAVDSINGAAGVIFPELLNRLGITWKGVYNKLDGDFRHNPEPRPEHLLDLADLLKSSDDFWGGFAFDPDADRLAPMGEKGQPISEEYTLAFALQTILAKTKTDIATNLSTSMIVDDVAARFGSTVYRTAIGEANVVAGMKTHHCAAGGEGNGGVIYPAIASVRDGLAALALIAELMAKKQKKLSALAAEIPEYFLVKTKIPLNPAMPPADVLQKLQIIFSNEKQDHQDGLKIIRSNGWVHLRASNTEPILRCYAEAKTQSEAQALADMVINSIN
jgi:phosphomannomutase